jgi:hypothetical protein
MSEWIPYRPYKAKPHERKSNRKRDLLRACRICGTPTNNGDTCKECEEFLRQKKREERGA